MNENLQDVRNEKLRQIEADIKILEFLKDIRDELNDDLVKKRMYIKYLERQLTQNTKEGSKLILNYLEGQKNLLIEILRVGRVLNSDASRTNEQLFTAYLKKLKVTIAQVKIFSKKSDLALLKVYYYLYPFKYNKTVFSSLYEKVKKERALTRKLDVAKNVVAWIEKTKIWNKIEEITQPLNGESIELKIGRLREARRVIIRMMVNQWTIRRMF